MVYAEVRHQLGRIGERGDGVALKIFLCERGDSNRYVLQRFLPLTRGNDDLLDGQLGDRRSWLDDGGTGD